MEKLPKGVKALGSVVMAPFESPLFITLSGKW